MGIVKRQGLSNTLLVYAGTAIGFLSLVVVQPHFLSKEELGLTRLILAFSSVYIFTQPEFLTLRPGNRVLFVLVLPILFPAAYCYVIFGDLLWPMVKRIWLWARMMRKADRAVRELMNGL